MATKKAKPKGKQKVIFTWDERRTKAAQLIAAGEKTEAEICAEIHVTRKTLWDWKTKPEFRARVDEIVSETAAALKQEGIRQKENRLDILQGSVSKILDLIEARAVEMGRMQGNQCEECGSQPESFVPGGSTGLLVRDYKSNGITPVYKFDAAVLRELREYLKQTAIEKREWTEGREHSGAIVNLDLSQLTDKQLDKFEQYLEAGETEQRAYTLARKA